MSKIRNLLIIIAVVILAAQAHAKPEITIERHKPCNLFSVDEKVLMNAKFAGFPAGDYEARVSLTDYFGEKKDFKFPLKIEEGKALQQALDLGTAAPGYYELKVSAQIKKSDGKTSDVSSETMSVGVVHFVNRTASEARKEGSRFGLKSFQIGPPGIWWRKPLVWNLDEVVDACARLGLQWTRHNFNIANPEKEPGIISTTDLITRHPMNVLLKIEGIPENAYDAKRYGPIDKFKENNKNKKGWSRTTVPLKEPYQEWLRKEIAKIPQEQNVFEIGNEVWDYMSGKEFAEWCQMVVPVIKEMRPGAVVGADPGSTSRMDFTEAFHENGGMNGMNAVFVHPYTFVPMPETRTRMELRNERDYLRMKTGKDFDFYVSEYGWSTAPKPKNGRSVTEVVQAKRTVRQSMMLYAEDMKTLVPHMMGDREEDPENWDHWFGFFRLNGQPKPVLVAHAVSARMIDSSRYVGEFHYGSGIGAMLFERKNIFTLVLWSGEDKDRELTVNLGVNEVTMVDIMGREKKLTAENGKLSLTLTPSAVYLVGVSPKMEEQALSRATELDPDQWWTRSGSYPLPQMKQKLEIDGALADWQVTETVVKNGSRIWLAYDKDFLYIAGEVPDTKVINDYDPSDKKKDITKGDAIVVQIGARPARQIDMAVRNIYDYEISLAPVSGSGKPALFVNNILWKSPVLHPAGGESSGIRLASGKADSKWTVEAAIPLKLLSGFPAAGEKISGSITLWNADTAGKSKSSMLLGDEVPARWPYFILEK
ncbi:MAG TPA: hypothetical protein DCZ94_15685 [Lentisphaeria bacterium]|nr:MAG: hypothetical protein A2X48_16930 [Lentisphaerae bacterium GWF2_49_21]HBC88390.1 hypothetical protein [Lentisphaeria bacterium]